MVSFAEDSPLSQPDAQRVFSDFSTVSTVSAVQPDASRSTSRTSGSTWLQMVLPRRMARPASQKNYSEVGPAYWGISQADLEFFKKEVWRLWADGSIPDNPVVPNPFHNNAEIGPTIYQVNEKYIKPATLEAGGMSWALMRNPNGLKCDMFASHAWAEGAFEFIWKVLANWPLNTRGLYCCFLANPQNGDIGSMLGADPSQSPFARALEVCSHVIIVPNRSVSVYSRLWCVFEADLAMQHGLVIIMPTRPKFRSVFLRGLPYLILAALTCVLFVFLEGPMGLITAGRPWTACNLQRLLVLLFAPVSHKIPKAYISSLCFAVGWQLAHWIVHDYTCFRMLFFEKTRAKGIMILEDNIESILITLTSVECLITELVFEALADEGKQLDSDSVRNASCSNETDRHAIRKLIAGREPEVDNMITLLKQVGRYDATVAANLQRGMRPSRVKEGVMHMRGVAGSCHWAEGLIRTICAAVSAPVALAVLKAGIALNILGCITVFCVTISLGAGTTFFVDALLYSSLIDHFANEFLWYFVYDQKTLFSVYTAPPNMMQTLCYSVVLVVVAASAVSSCIWFHRRPVKSQLPDLSLEDETESSTEREDSTDDSSEGVPARL